jgi:hypothetical protein
MSGFGLLEECREWLEVGGKRTSCRMSSHLKFIAPKILAIASFSSVDI